MKAKVKLPLGCFLIVLAAWAACLAAWVTHVIVCLSAKAWLLLLTGALIAPVGIIHGVCIWFGHSFL